MITMFQVVSEEIRRCHSIAGSGKYLGGISSKSRNRPALRKMPPSPIASGQSSNPSSRWSRFEGGVPLALRSSASSVLQVRTGHQLAIRSHAGPISHLPLLAEMDATSHSSRLKPHPRSPVRPEAGARSTLASDTTQKNHLVIAEFAPPPRNFTTPTETSPNSPHHHTSHRGLTSANIRPTCLTSPSGIRARAHTARALAHGMQAPRRLVGCGVVEHMDTDFTFFVAESAPTRPVSSESTASTSAVSASGKSPPILASSRYD